MAITTRAVLSGTNSFICDVKASLDADTTITIPHGLGTIPKGLTLTMLVGQAPGAESNWAVTAVDATSVTLTKQTAAGSGNSTFFQVRFSCSTPHSLVG
jgi:hypothetical protein